MGNMFVWHHLYVNPAPVHRDVRQFQSHAALLHYLFTGVSSVTLLWFLIQAGLLTWMRTEQMPPPHFKSHCSAGLVLVASDNTAADSCWSTSKTVLASENNFPFFFFWWLGTPLLQKILIEKVKQSFSVLNWHHCWLSPSSTLQLWELRHHLV